MNRPGMAKHIPRLVLDSGAAGEAQPHEREPSRQAPANQSNPLRTAEGEPLREYLRAIRQVDEAWRGELPVLLRAIIREGRRFAGTPEGARWKAFLADSPLVRNGWLVWSVSGLDFLVRSEDESELTPSDLWQQITTRLAGLDVEPFLEMLMQDLTYDAVRERSRDLAKTETGE